MTYLTIIAAFYVAAGLTSIFYITRHKIDWLRITLPLIRLRWDKHGWLDVALGMIYGGVDYFIRIGLLAH